MLATAIIVLPNSADAFWPFSTDAATAANAFIPDPETPVLVAAINANPNPNKGLSAIFQTSDEKALLAFMGPAGTIADVSPTGAPGRISVYVVRDGDTLSEIATMFNVSINTVMWANDLKSVRDVHPGDTLVILPVTGVEHTVAKGDTLRSLAKKYNGDADEIATFNSLDPSAPLAVGTTVIVPGGEISVPATAVPRASSPSSPLIRGGGAFIAGYYGNPLPGARVTQGLHGWNGVDLGAPRGTPIRAAADGIVVIARTGWNGGYGTYVVIQHGNGTQTLYSHNSSNAAGTGQSVLQGQVIGYVGSSGRSTGSHLHFEVRGAGNPFRSCRVGSVCAPQ